MHLKTSDLQSLRLGFGGYTCNWGAHICGLYETKAERDEIMYGFLAEGLRSGELLVCCPEPSRYDGARGELHSLCPEAGPDELAAIRLLEPAKLYYPHGNFSPRDMLAAHDGIWAENLAAGARNVRGTADMAWSLEKIPGVEKLMAYESMLNYFIWGKTWISICMYDLSRFPGSTVMKVLQTHPFAITGGGVYENPYFVRPEKWLAANAPEFAHAS
jgi:MEDS: MEthanogen/methylotroph, DcmR Sensory domain